MRFQDLSIQVKIVLALALTFSVLLVVSAVFINSSQRELVTKLASEKVDDIANAYFDGVNTMMLTGTTTQRTILKSKMLESDNVVDVTILRSEELIKIFGKGIEGELATSAEDQRALQGDSFQLLEKTDQGRQVTTWMPLKASSNYRGTNCLTCHAVPEGTVLGAVKATYSMAASDRKVTDSLIKSTMINLLLFAVGIGVILLILRKLLIKPIVNIRQVMHEAAQNSDVTTRLPVYARDEIGTLASAINEMLGSFQSSIKNVIETAHKVSKAAGQISQVSEATYNAAYSQLSETNNVATAMTELAASANEVNESADKTANASVSADTETSNGRNMTDQAVSGIHHLISEIENAADVINLLDDRSQGIGQVLDVIRSIAEQTNLLALNAAIEAARAGESGRGFAVVADEVRNLANRSYESTEEIQQLIEQLQTDAKKAVETMTIARESATERGSQIEAAGNSLTSIAEQVGQIRELNTQMANAAREQSLVTEDVTKNITSISQIAQDTSLDAQKVNDFSQELVKLSNELKQLVDRFTV